MRDFHDRTAYEQTKTPAPARVIFQEFLKVLGRTEAEQPLIWYSRSVHMRSVLAVPALSPSPVGLGGDQNTTEEEEGEGENKGEVESGEVIMLDDRLLEKISKMPPTAGYAGDRDLVDVSVYLWDDEYTKEDRNALGLLQGAMRAAHLPPLEVVDCREVPSVWEIVDEHTSSSRVLAGGSGNVSPSPSPSPSGSYEEFKLDRRRAPHTVGSAHLYIRRDIVEAAERESIVPPYPVTFPHDYPYKHDNWYLDGLQRHGSGRVVKRSETDG
ncbi:hypothetical protein MYCTH_2070514 [Thermothelomyces thermophilus ATCC 42464]|uniref:Uncharacterized protein n=1 Tax=Thermothelomyces thermophilus (strain ATCC 42464 / BCRC 31852 / DSM 1799) TaxID=573729 RepID=G2QLL5_THET4|nr:uncharacterized protein MYCTH_2070514 [Thermothelomyces thermophilus ATCC 42464]AEO60845.1 hypothetical protein MYCTH_2070514 [Thermothelomyces thermophilus ATCC 42464]